jgi:hypothetical protein
MQLEIYEAVENEQASSKSFIFSPSIRINQIIGFVF